MDRRLLTKRAQLLLCIADDCDVRMRDLAQELGITERTAYDLLCELIEDGYVTRERQGRRNCYRIHPEKAPRVEQERSTVGELASLLSP